MVLLLYPFGLLPDQLLLSRPPETATISFRYVVARGGVFAHNRQPRDNLQITLTGKVKR